MRHHLALALALDLALIAFASAASAQDADCTGFKWPVDREMTAFKGEALPAITSGGALPALGEPAILKLVPQDQVTYPSPPKRKPKHTPAYGGTFNLPPIAAAETYQVTLSDDAWIDVVQDGKLVRQVGFTAGHGCKIVHKSLRFPLTIGPATIEISDAAADSVKIEVLPKQQ